MITNILKRYGIFPNQLFTLRHYLDENQNKWLDVEFMFDGKELVSTNGLIVEIKDIIYLLASGIYSVLEKTC